MFTYQCPGCGKQHLSEPDFDYPFETRCLRCTEAFQVTEEIVHGARATAFLSSPATDLEEAITAGIPSAAGESIDEEDAGFADPDNSDALEALAAEAGGGSKRSRGVGKRRGGRSAGLHPDEIGGDSAPSDRMDVEEVVEDVNEDAQGWRKPADPKKRFVVTWATIAALAVGTCVLAGSGAYFVFFRGTSKKPPDKVARSTTKTRSATVVEAPSTEKEIPPTPNPIAKVPEPPAKPQEQAAVRLSAARLAAELAFDADATNRKYEKAVLEVSGPFQKIEIKRKIEPTASDLPAIPIPFALFAVDGPVISCDLEASPTEITQWQTLQREHPITVRGHYGKDGVLHDCELLPLTAPNEEKYKGKEIELAGFAYTVVTADPRTSFPTIVLEPETNSRVEVDCLFRKTDEQEVRKIQPGVPVTIRGICNGRSRVGDKFRVRLDNCQLVYTTAPVAPMVRIEAVQFSRDYEEDLFSSLRPALGAEEFLETPVSVTQLAKESAADAKALDRKLRNKLIVVTGRLQSKLPPRTLVLESGDTDQLFKVQCVFSPHEFADLDSGPEYRIRGLFTGAQGGQTLRLDNCEAFDPAKTKDPRRLTADYLPHTPERSLVYDMAVYPTTGNGTPSVVRQIFLQRDGGITETLTTHSGKLVGKSLFVEGEQSRWVAQRKTQKVRLPGPVFERRVSWGFVEIGHHVPTKNGATQTVWEPALKLQAKTGESWTWVYEGSRHQYTVVKFQEEKGRTTVLINETVTQDRDPDHPSQIRHVYVRNLGESERRESLKVTSREERVVSERKLVTDTDADGSPGPGEMQPIIESKTPPTTNNKAP